MTADYAVIGGGVVGASAAYHLAKADAKTLLVDANVEGQASAAGAGIVAPGIGLRHPRLYYPLAVKAVEYYPALLEHLREDGEGDTGYENVGSLFVAMNELEADRLDVVLRLLEERLDAGVPNMGRVEALTRQEAQERFPALADIAGAVATAGAARVDGRKLRDAMRRAAERRGAQVVTGRAELSLTRGGAPELRVDGEAVSVGTVILAAGAWTGRLKLPGVAVPVVPQRGQIIHFEVPDRFASPAGSWPIVSGFDSYYMITFPPRRVVVGATREDGSGYDVRLTAQGVREVLEYGLRVAPGLCDATLAEVRVGLRPATPDHLPILGPFPGSDRVFIATGNGPSGLTAGPFCGSQVARAALGETPTFDLGPYSVERFSAA